MACINATRERITKTTANSAVKNYYDKKRHPRKHINRWDLNHVYTVRREIGPSTTLCILFFLLICFFVFTNWYKSCLLLQIEPLWNEYNDEFGVPSNGFYVLQKNKLPARIMNIWRHIIPFVNDSYCVQTDTLRFVCF